MLGSVTKSQHEWQTAMPQEQPATNPKGLVVRGPRLRSEGATERTVHAPDVTAQRQLITQLKGSSVGRGMSWVGNCIPTWIPGTSPGNPPGVPDTCKDHLLSAKPHPLRHLAWVCTAAEHARAR